MVAVVGAGSDSRHFCYRNVDEDSWGWIQVSLPKHLYRLAVIGMLAQIALQGASSTTKVVINLLLLMGIFASGFIKDEK